MAAQTLTGKVAVVTGGAGGIGRAVALALSAEGAKVVVNDVGRDAGGASAAERVAREIEEAGGSAAANSDSVDTVRGGESIVETALSHFGRVDILVNCAGNLKRGGVTELSEEDWDAQIDVQLKGHFTCTRAAVMDMAKRKSGRIINIASRAAFPWTPGGGPAPGLPGGSQFAYGTAKAAIMGLTTNLARDLAPLGITVNAILPSADTPMFPGKFPRGAELPGSQALEPEYVAPIIAYLATDQAAGITGQFIYASGFDVCIYDRPLLPSVFVRKDAKWTVQELAEAIPPLLAQK
ncbi:MAG: SDR family NAD(P)-dependent oxidoreductase [Chloroflexota bacterium]|nr:SDR family NAD(P)-dependent oxidoreductase [Chloroflexota bacterium]